ncbi:SDR family oxidoreductase [Nocardia abscessus]|uniref:SDR family oxidoreductase n=1 Tax=Nocardia abscessus TaxID=120957 RepID=UPI002456CA5A|nr:SDR family oxidoreductase [Nocardia abscessus]
MNAGKAVVAGGTHGMRLAIVEALLAEGVEVVLIGRVDALFVNHGTAAFQTLDAATEESFDRQFTINTKGAFFTVQRSAPLLSEGGSIVFTTVVFPGLSAYSGSKEALRAIARVLAAELPPRRIRVNSVAPGFIETPTMGVVGLTEQQRAEFLEQGERSTPLRRNETVHEVAKVALFLAFDATFTTGVELPVDDGWAQGLGAYAEAAA